MLVIGKPRLWAVCCFFMSLVSFLISHVCATDFSNKEKEYLRAKDTMIFVSQTRYPPFEFTDLNGQHEGIMLDVVRWIAVETGFRPVFMDMTFQQAQEAVLSGQADIITSLFYSDTWDEVLSEQISVSAAAYMGKKESVLIVDDVKEQRELAAKMLTKLNYRVTTVSSGEEAVEYLEQHAVDLIVLDMIMDPGMDGLDTYARVLEIHPRQRAIIVSGYSETERVSNAMAIGAGAYVKKPYVLETLGSAIRKELDRIIPPTPSKDTA